MSLEINTDDFWKELYQPVLDARTERKLFIEEITKLREQVAAQAAVIEAIRNCLKEIRGLSYATTWEIINEALAVPTDSTQILDEVRRAEREKCAKVCDENHWDDHRLFAEKIRAME